MIVTLGVPAYLLFYLFIYVFVSLFILSYEFTSDGIHIYIKIACKLIKVNYLRIKNEKKYKNTETTTKKMLG